MQFRAEYSFCLTRTDNVSMSQKEPSRAWNAKHSMIPTERRDVTKVTPIGTRPET